MSSTITNPKEWLILQCQSCGSPMKVRAQTAAATRVSCPACHSPVTVSQAGATHFPEFRADVPQSSPETIEAARRRMAEESGEDTEFMPTLGSGTRPLPDEMPAPRTALSDTDFLHGLKQTEGAESQDAKRVRKRRKKVSESRSGGLADWNTVLDELPEAEILADTWLTPGGLPEEGMREEEKSILISESVEDGQTKRRVKRVRRRAIFGFAQLFFRRLSYGLRVTIVVMSSIIGIGGMTYAIITLKKKFTPVTFDDVVENQKIDPRILTSQEEGVALDILREFLKAEGMEKKLPLVRLPNRVRPLMEAWYQKRPDKSVEIGDLLERGKIQMDGIYFVKLRVDVKEPNPIDPGQIKTVPRDFVIEVPESHEKKDFKVDWELAVDWRPMSFDEFRRQQPKQPVPFRVKIEGSDYYNHSFLDERRWLACRIYVPLADNTKEFLFHGYIDRRSKAWEDLAVYTDGSNNGSLIIGLRYPENAVSYDEVIVDGLIHPSWIYTKDLPDQEKKPDPR